MSVITRFYDYRLAGNKAAKVFSFLSPTIFGFDDHLRFFDTVFWRPYLTFSIGF